MYGKNFWLVELMRFVPKWVRIPGVRFEPIKVGQAVGEGVFVGSKLIAFSVKW